MVEAFFLELVHHVDWAKLVLKPDSIDLVQSFWLDDDEIHDSLTKEASVIENL
jgi:hypothetical protein